MDAPRLSNHGVAENSFRRITPNANCLTPVALTSVSLLERLKCAPPDDPQWRRLQDIYHPWILRWLKRVPQLGDEANDLAQDVLIVVV